MATTSSSDASNRVQEALIGQISSFGSNSGGSNSVLEYNIEACSSHSASYNPNHIKVNKPQDQSSRWSSGSNNQMQFIALKLDKLAIACTITFGKYHKVHVCNLKEFKVYGGLELNNMTEVLHAGLRNDSEPETFSLKFMANGVKVPCRYIKIVPLLAWGANFNFSIWFVELRGVSDPTIVNQSLSSYLSFREKEAVRLCLKHFRQRNLLGLFKNVQEGLGLEFEHGLLTELHQNIVIDGNFDDAEKLLQKACTENLFDEYISDLPYKLKWSRILHANGAATSAPSMRGGHQMCIDSEDGVIYLFGGWDGTKDLADFWAYYERDETWKCLSMDTRKHGGPEPRSCHKICFDPQHKVIYTLGKYVDPDSRPNIPLDSDFWKYDTLTHKWTKICTHTAAEGGPELIYDHQMLVDSDAGVLYVFGGREISPDPTLIKYSGLYSWSITSNTWKHLRDDTYSGDGTAHMKSRIGHSMLFNHISREIYIFAGQRHKDFLADFYIYQIENDTVVEVSRDYSKSGGMYVGCYYMLMLGPDAGFTQRATIDVGLGEFYVLSGLMREKNSLSETKNSFWVYSIKKNRWIKVYENDNTGSEYWSQMDNQEPRPRFAHQLVYNTNLKCQYLFGGNPGESNQPNLRLDDFWQLFLARPLASDILRKSLFQIRTQKFKELCTAGDKNAALTYLQTYVSLTVNHDDPEESQQFRALVLYLFSWNPKRDDVSSLRVSRDDPVCRDVFQSRISLYENLLVFFPESMREPKANLIDLIPM